jgi:hypothetical protein
MNAVEPIADTLTGALAARAAEPAAGVDASGHTTERACLNCGTLLAGDYCHACGQRGHVHRSLGAFVHDLLHGVFHFEGKIWRTLPLLVWRPGELTRRYIDGQRASFVSPIALFLFFVFLLFAVISLAGPRFGFNDADVRAGIARELEDEEQALASLRRERAAAAGAGRPTAALDARISQREEEIAAARAVIEQGFGGPAARISAPATGFGQLLEEARKNPDLLLFKLKTNSYKFSWALIPLSVPLVWLLFPFSRRFRLYDHVVFVTYSLCFMSLLVIGWVLLSALNFGSALLLLVLVPPFHMYRQLRGTYGLSRGSALWRTVVLATGALVILTLFGVGLFLLGAA